MPTLSPLYGLVFTIGDLENEVILKVENRTQDKARADVWLRDAILDIAGNTDLRDEFDNLEEFGPKFNLTVGTQEYPFINLIPSGDLNMATLSVLIWTDPPTNSLRQQLRWGSFQEADKIQLVNSVPQMWYRFGDFIGFSPLPGKAYQIQCRILRQHPFQDNLLSATEILLPRDWNEIIVWAAALRGFMELEQFEKAAALRAMLYGDPTDQTRPGLIKAHKKRRERENWRQQATLAPDIRSMGWGR